MSSKGLLQNQRSASPQRACVKVLLVWRPVRLRPNLRGTASTPFCLVNVRQVDERE